MIENIVKQLTGNVAQYTNLFDTQTVSTTCQLLSNTITIAGLNGDYALTGGIDGIASKGCFNGVHTFTAGVAVTDCFFGDVATTQNCVYHKLNVGTAINRDYAVEVMIDDKTPNCVIVYWDSTQNTKTTYSEKISEDAYTKLKVSFGVMLKIDSDQMEALGSYDVLDKIIANSIIDAEVDGATLVRFDNIKDRFFAGKYHCIDLGFSYLEEMTINAIIRDRVRHYNAILENLETTI